MLLQKLVPSLFYPTFWVLACLLVALILQARARVKAATFCIVLGLSILVTTSLPVVAVRLWKTLESQNPILSPAQLPTAEAIVLLGGGILLPSPPRVMPELNGASDRVWFAAELYHAGKAPLIVVSGGQVFPQPDLLGEADYHRLLLLRMGVPDSAIVLETHSADTAENAKNTAELLAPRGIQHVLLVTSAMHMPRASLLFRETGLNVDPAPCDVHGVEPLAPNILQWIPRAWAATDTEDILHEWLSLQYFRLRAYFRQVL